MLLAASLLAPTAPGRAEPSLRNRTTLRSLYGLPRPVALSRGRTALVLIDFQDEFVHGVLRLPMAVASVRSTQKLLAWARAQGLLVVHVRNIAARTGSRVFAEGSPGADIVPELAPGSAEPLFTKSAGGAFTGTELDAWLRKQSVDTLILAGWMTHLAIQLSAADATVRGYRVLVAADATATRDLPGAAGRRAVDHDTLQGATLAALADRFAEVLSVREITALAIAESISGE